MNTRFPTTAARRSLAARFALPDHDNMQDWEWELADRRRFHGVVAAYRPVDLNDDERFSLMEILIQCVEDNASETGFGQRETSDQWHAVEILLRQHSALHAPTIKYWACFNQPDLTAGFPVTARMRALWHDLQEKLI